MKALSDRIKDKMKSILRFVTIDPKGKNSH